MADWIPVTERLPDTCAPVLVYLHWGFDDDEITVGEYWGNSKASPGWGIFDPYVTHWMPLPTPPVPVMYYPQVEGITPTVISDKEGEE